ncbi:hypothetical protein UACE39S_06173 [Ureibacillus acetophenoni]
MPRENLECFLSGLQQLFEQVGGVPISIRIDNLTPAVKKVRKGDTEAELTEAFVISKITTASKFKFVILKVVMKKVMSNERLVMFAITSLAPPSH